jgi:hypothetical protein
MSLPNLSRWLTADWTHGVTAACVAFLAYAFAWAAIRASYERVVGKPMPRTRLVLVLDIAADLAVNVPGALNRLLRATGRDPLFLPAPPRAPAAPSGRSGQSGCATAPALALAGFVGLLALGFVGLALQGCPRLPPVSDCAPFSYRCNADRPEVCSSTRRWHSIGDLDCAAVGARCSMEPDGMAVCVSDGGAP